MLLFQDVSIIPMLALLPLAASLPAPTEESAAFAALPAWGRPLVVLAVVAAIVLAGRYLMQPLFRWVAGTGIREIFVAFALLIVVGITLLMQEVGLSAALGTFLAGVVLADSEYRHELEMDLEPFKGLLLAVFFIAVGAGIDFALLERMPAGAARHRLWLHGRSSSSCCGLLAVAFRMQRADASRFSFSLAQGGEFAFVLVAFALGLAAHRRRGGRAARRRSGDLDGVCAAADARRRQAAPAAARAARPTSARPTLSTRVAPRSSSRAMAGSA